MKIIRDGKEIELTKKEMIEAYYEQEYNFDVEYITGSLLDQYIDDCSDEMIDRLRNNPKFASRVAHRYRKYLEDAYGSEYEFDCLLDAYDYIKDFAI